MPHNNYVAYDAIAYAYAQATDITIDEARDIIKQVISVCTDTLAGETNYNSIDDVINDYLGLGSVWTPLFLDK